MFSTACSEEPPHAATPVEVRTAIYEVRGEITSLPDADNPTTSLNIKHEAIPDFVDAQGKIVGMDTMTMPFPPAEGLDLAPFSVGDKVEVTFEVTWAPGQNGWEATAIKPLPPETELDFTKIDTAHHDHSGHDHGDHGGHQH
ncbi:MAG: copper-binding protein [Planctomycetota bacterium]